jgi:hypothetical protein
MKTPQMKPGYLLAIVLTIIASIALIYAGMYGAWVNTYMSTPIDDDRTKVLFEASAPFGQKMIQGNPSDQEGPSSPPVSNGPTNPPPRN